jgi:hypothetical protein
MYIYDKKNHRIFKALQHVSCDNGVLIVVHQRRDHIDGSEAGPCMKKDVLTDDPTTTMVAATINAGDYALE